jgi:hypothetical protein
VSVANKLVAHGRAQNSIIFNKQRAHPALPLRPCSMVAARPDGLLKQDIGGLQETVSFTPQS